MGGVMHTVQNLRVLLTDSEKGILVVKGLVSGPKKAYVRVQDSKKMPWQLKTMGLKTGEELEASKSEGSTAKSMAPALAKMAVPDEVAAVEARI
jgi:hypothetical protein